MSPKLTRHDKFYYSLTTCMEKYSAFLCTLDDTYPGIEKWDLENKTSSSNNSLQVYVLSIPTKYVAYHIETKHQINGVWYEPGPIYKKNSFIYKTIHDAFLNHFGVSNPSNKAYTDMMDMKEEKNIVICKIHVQYHSKYPLPYPVSEDLLSIKEKYELAKKENQNLLLEVEELENLFDTLEYKYDKMKGIRSAENNQHNKNYFQLQKKIRELYQMVGVCSDCPVCWEPIPSEKLIVPGCGHYICEGCNGRCTKCPICRQSAKLN